MQTITTSEEKIIIDHHRRIGCSKVPSSSSSSYPDETEAKAVPNSESHSQLAILYYIHITPRQLASLSPVEDAHAPVKCERNDRWSIIASYRPDVRQWISLAMTILAVFGASIIWVDINRRRSGQRIKSRSSISKRHSYGSSVRCVCVCVCAPQSPKSLPLPYALADYTTSAVSMTLCIASLVYANIYLD